MQASSSTENESNWKFAQCFGDKGESDDITEGNEVIRLKSVIRKLFEIDEKDFYLS